jgi:hypothetical protein
VADLDPIGPLAPPVPPPKGDQRRRKIDREAEKPARSTGTEPSDSKRNTPDEPDHQVDEYA